ncbi:MAG: hypothetical protein JWM40_75 [Frankiales bacterium]|nr:hypothetical protein [Frankiales bacterium]
MRRAIAVLLLVLGFTMLSTPVLAVGKPTAIGPTKTAWWDATYPTTTPAEPPLPPLMTADQLLVAGVTVPLGPPTNTTVRGIQALIGISFTVPEGTSPASFRLVLTGGVSTATGGARLPTGVALEACPAAAFKAGGHQAFDLVPAYDCTGRTSLASLSPDGTAMVFSDIARVARGKNLTFVIRPATTGPDRLVFLPPTARSLSLLSFDSPPVFDSGGGAPVLPPPPFVPPVPTTAPGVTSPSLPPVAPPVVGLPPVVPTAAPETPAVVKAASTIDDGETRAGALAGLVLLVVAVGWLAATDRRPKETEWGFGRYRGPRDGRAPSL